MRALRPTALLDDSRLRTLQIGGRLLSYRLKRSSRRTIGFVISRTGLTITAPMRLSLIAIESAIAEKQRWIFSKLEEWLDRDEPLSDSDTPTDWQDGAQIPLCGSMVTLRLIRSSTVVKRGIAAVHYDADAQTLTLNVLNSAEAAQIGALLKRWLQTHARRCFAERLDVYAPLVGVRFNALALSSATTRWGSCSSTGNIRLNWRLVFFALDVIDYVVIHELSHLREMNHSPRFWAIVEAVMPDYKRARTILKRPAPGAIPAL